MKVLQVYKTYFPDDFTGIPQVIAEIAEGIRGQGDDSLVFCLSAHPRKHPIAIGSHEVHQGKKLMSVASTDLSVSAFSKFSRLARSADLVHYHFPWPFGDLLHFHARPSSPVVVTYHSDIVKQRPFLPFYEPLMHRFLRRADRIVATSERYLDTSRVLAEYRSKATVIPIGIGPRREPEPEIVRRWRDSVGEDFFLFIGANRYYKGLDFLLKAARATGLPVVIAGVNTTPDHIGDVPENVRLLGPVSDVDKEALLDLSRAVVLPSHLRSEAFGVVLVEAARAGKPMISCEIGTGTSFVNMDGETGLVVPPADPAAIAEAITTLHRDPALARQYGANARARYLACLQAKDMVARYSDLYRELVGSR